MRALSCYCFPFDSFASFELNSKDLFCLLILLTIVGINISTRQKHDPDEALNALNCFFGSYFSPSNTSLQWVIFSQNAFLLHYYKSFYLLFRKVGFVKYIFFCTWFCSLKNLNEQKLKRVLINVLNNFIMFLIWIFKLWIVWVETIWQLSPKQKDQLQTGKLCSSRTYRLIIDTSPTKEFFQF
jgi:hypothetical protein